MEIDITSYCEKIHYTPTYSEENWKIIASEKLDAISERQDKKLENTDVHFSINSQTGKITFKNSDLSKLIDYYNKLRTEKTGFNNPLWYVLLKEYIYEYLPLFVKEFWEKMSELKQNIRILTLQYIGNNLRITKDPYGGDAEFKYDGFTSIAEDINLAIKILRSYVLEVKNEDDILEYQSNENKRCMVIIDSIKNPYESMYLKRRYTNYYLLGVYTDENQRKNRIRNLERLNDEAISVIDTIESNADLNKKLSDCTNTESDDDFINHIRKQIEKCKILKSINYVSSFIFQNVPGCLEVADILINNETEKQSYLNLKKVLLKYVSLIMNPGLVLPTPVERCMQIAYNAKLNSGCISRQVGAVLTDSHYHILSIGWNQQPEGQLPCAYRDLCEMYYQWVEDEYSEYELDENAALHKAVKNQVESLLDTHKSPLKDKGKLSCYCFKDYYNSIDNKSNQVHTRALHAEETAFLQLGANIDRVKNGILFTTSSPCELCSKKAMYLGISKIYYVEPYTGISRTHVMNIGNLEKRPELILFTGAVGIAYTKLFTPLLQRKDENEMWFTAKMNTCLIQNISDHKTDESEAYINGELEEQLQ